jgi:hypothetical protein
VEEDAAVFGFAGFVDGFFAADGGGEEGDDCQDDEPVPHVGATLEGGEKNRK